MFCPNCGSQTNDNSQFCGNCGATLNAQPAAPAQPQQPVYQAPAYSAPPATPVSKFKYAATMGNQNTKTTNLISWIAIGLAALFLILGLNSALNGPFYEIPILAMAIGDDFDAEAAHELGKEAADYVDELEAEYKEELDYLSSSEKKQAKKMISLAKDLARSFSIANVVKSAEVMDEFGAIDDDTVEILEIFMSVIWLFFAIPMLFTLLAFWKKSTGLTVTALIFALIFCFIFGGILWGVLCAVAYILHAVLCKKLTQEYKAYRSGAPIC